MKENEIPSESASYKEGRFKEIFYLWRESGGYIDRRVLTGQKMNYEDGLETPKQVNLLKKREREREKSWRNLPG